MARCLAINVSYLFNWPGVTESDTSDEYSPMYASKMDDQSALRMSSLAALATSSSQTHPLIQNKHISRTSLDKTETSLAAVQASGGKEKAKAFVIFHFVVRGLLGPLMAVFGVREDRTGGLGPAERKEHYLTAAPFHRFDGDDADWHRYVG
jgi:hypothetical protein